MTTTEMSWPAGWSASPPSAPRIIPKTASRNYSLGNAWRTGNTPRWLDGAIAEALAVRNGTSVARVATPAAAKPPPPPKDIELDVEVAPPTRAAKVSAEFKRIFCVKTPKWKAPKCVIA